MTLREALVLLAAAGSVFYLLFRILIAAHFAAKRRYMRKLMDDLNGETNGK